MKHISDDSSEMKKHTNSCWLRSPKYSEGIERYPPQHIERVVHFSTVVVLVMCKKSDISRH